VNEAVNLVKLLADLPKRSKACIVLTQEVADQKTWAAELASQAEAKHLDLLDLFAEDEALGTTVSTFGVNHLFALLQQQDGAAVFIVTGLEFLRAAWSGRASAMEDFAKRLEFWEKSPALVFVTQHDSFLSKRKFDQRFQYTYVVDQRDTLAL
jgi:Xaa-Pro aminopeptidase